MELMLMRKKNIFEQYKKQFFYASRKHTTYIFKRFVIIGTIDMVK